MEAVSINKKPDFAFRGEAVSLVRLKNENETLCEAVLMALLVDLSDSVKAKQNLSDEDIPPLARKIIKEYYWMKFEEIKFVFECLKSGRLIKIYDRLDEVVIFDAFHVFDTQVRQKIVDDHNSSLTPDLPDRRYRQEFEREEARKLDKAIEQEKIWQKAKEKVQPKQENK